MHLGIATRPASRYAAHFTADCFPVGIYMDISIAESRKIQQPRGTIITKK